MKPRLIEEAWQGWTSCQRRAWEEIGGMFSARDRGPRVGVLRGFAGTGKTHWLAQVVRHLELENWAVQVLTPTGRAAQVVAERLAPYGLKTKPRTIHSCIYEIEPIDYSSDQLSLFATTRELDGWGPTLYVIDESSMIGNEKRERQERGYHFGSGSLLHDLLESVGLKANEEVRILFVGDSSQLPPIGGKEATPALSALHIRHVLDELGVESEILEAELVTVVRQGEGSLKAFVEEVRRGMEIGEHLPRKALADVRPIDAADLMEAYLGQIQNGSAPTQAIILAHSNGDVYRYNTQVRKELQRDERAFHSGELLLIKRNVLIPDHGELEISGVLASLKNGTFIQMVDEPHLRRTVSVPVRGELMELRFWSARIRVLGSNEEVTMTILENYVSPKLWLGTSHARSEHQANIETAVLLDFQKRMKAERGWDPPKPGDLHYTQYDRAAQIDPYLRSVRVAYGYAVTVHNAQGGEWPVVYVDPASNKARDWQHDPKHRMSFSRWVYTASTRAQKSLWFIRHAPLAP